MYYHRSRIALTFAAALLLNLSATTRAADTSAPATATQTNQVKAQTFEVRHYEVSGNTILSQDLIDRNFTNAIGPAVSLEDIRKSLGDLQLAYRERGYVTVALSLPQQQLTNGIVKIDVTEAKLAAIKVRGNQYFSSNNVLRDLPSLRTNALLNSHIFQRELDQANLNRDRQIYPNIEPGPVPGTSALILRVKDRFPFHARADLDNYSTPGTPDLRVNLSAQYNNLWQYNHQLGISYGMSPDRYKADGLTSDYLINQPQISYYGAYYRIPFGAASVADQITNSTRFGYNEATHQFALPPSSDRPDFTIYASASGSDTGVKTGELQTITNTATETVQSQTSGRNYSENWDLGGRFTLPVAQSDKIRWNFFGGVDFKHSALTVYSTNTDITSIFFDPSTGTAPIPPIFTSSASAPNKNSVTYLPINVGVDFSETDSQGSSSANVTASYSFMGGSANFAAQSYSANARESFGKINLSLSREQKIYGGWSMLARGGAQDATGALISNEQFPLGGLNSVRGYYEGDDYGDAGFFGSLELRTPYWETRVASINDYVPAWVRASVFVDYGQRYLLETSQGTPSSHSLLGTGFGFTGNIDNHIDVRFALAWPLISTANSRAGDPHVYFSVGGQF